MSIFRSALVVALGLGGATPAPAAAQDGSGRKPVTIRQTVEMRMFLRSGVALSPDGRQVAYVLVEPSFAKNYNEHVVYLIDLPGSTARGAPVSLGRGKELRASEVSIAREEIPYARVLV